MDDNSKKKVSKAGLLKQLTAQDWELAPEDGDSRPVKKRRSATRPKAVGAAKMPAAPVKKEPAPEVKEVAAKPETTGLKIAFKLKKPASAEPLAPVPLQEDRPVKPERVVADKPVSAAAPATPPAPASKSEPDGVDSVIDDFFRKERERLYGRRSELPQERDEPSEVAEKEVKQEEPLPEEVKTPELKNEQTPEAEPEYARMPEQDQPEQEKEPEQPEPEPEQIVFTEISEMPEAEPAAAQPKEPEQEPELEREYNPEPEFTLFTPLAEPDAGPEAEPVLKPEQQPAPAFEYITQEELTSVKAGRWKKVKKTKPSAAQAAPDEGEFPADKPGSSVFSNLEKGSVVLEVKNLTKHFGKRVSVNNVSFDVRAGEIFGFLGPNGAGKTTTIRMVSGLARITEGEVYICGKSIKSNFKDAVRNIGGIIENPEMYKYMTGWDNMRYYADLFGGISDARIMDVVRLVRMEKRIHEKVKRYSLGMRQRVGIAQSLLHNPKILMLDEPTNGLDPAGIHEMRDFLKMLAHERGLAIFISSHILTEMQLMCDRVAIISNGNLVAIKTVDEWTQSTEATTKLKLVATDTEAAESLLAVRYGVKAERGGNMLIFNLDSGLLAGLSKTLSDNGIGILTLAIGEKTLEETFLELTASQGVAIN